MGPDLDAGRTVEGSEGMGQYGLATGMIVLRELGADDWRDWRSMRLAALADAPGAFSSTFAEWSGAGDSEERWRSRLQSVAHNVLAELDGRAVGMVSATAPGNGDVELLSLWVAPAGRGRGVGDALVRWVKERAGRSRAARIVLDVRTDNGHAIALYARHGFCDVGLASEPGDPNPERRMAAALPSRESHDAAPDR